MTINKPEVVSVYRTDTGGTDKMVCLSDYEALQAECEQLVEALEASTHRLHEQPDGEDDCMCSQCRFVLLRDAALAAHHIKENGNE